MATEAMAPKRIIEVFILTVSCGLVVELMCEGLLECAVKDERELC